MSETLNPFTESKRLGIKEKFVTHFHYENVPTPLLVEKKCDHLSVNKKFTNVSPNLIQQPVERVSEDPSTQKYRGTLPKSAHR